MNTQAAAEAPPSRSNRGWLARSAQVAFVLAVIGAVAFGLYSRTRDDTSARITSSLAGLRLKANVTGDAAVAEMVTMHQSDIRIRDGWVGLYERTAVIYVGEAASASDAELLVR